MTIFYCLRFETPKTWRARFPYLYPPGTGGPVIPPGTGFLFRRLLRLAGLRWRYSTPPPHWIPPSQAGVLFIKPVCTERAENTVSNSSSVAACVSVAAGTCLPSCSIAAAIYSCLLIIWCLATEVVPLFVSQPLPRNKCFFRAVR
jgi:hypothetical protein